METFCFISCLIVNVEGVSLSLRVPWLVDLSSEQAARPCPTAAVMRRKPSAVLPGPRVCSEPTLQLALCDAPAAPGRSGQGCSRKQQTLVGAGQQMINK